MYHDMLHVIVAQCVAGDLLTTVPGHLMVHVGDGLQHSEEIVNNLKLHLSVQLLLLVVFSIQSAKRG